MSEIQNMHASRVDPLTDQVSYQCSDCATLNLVPVKHHFGEFPRCFTRCHHCQATIVLLRDLRLDVDSPRLTVARFDKVAQFGQGLSFDDLTFRIVLRLRIISASARMHRHNYGHPARRERLGSRSPDVFYWRQWDFGVELVTLLANACREGRGELCENALWDDVDPFFVTVFNQQFELGRDVTIHSTDFEGLCHAMAVSNAISIGNYRLTTSGHDDADDAYGLPTSFNRWHLTNSQLTDTQFFDEDFPMACEIFHVINGRAPNELEYGETSRRLKSWYESR